jgi:hypothetical protein
MLWNRETWVYRVSVNYIPDVKKSPVERLHVTFDRFAEDADGMSKDGPNRPRASSVDVARRLARALDPQRD